MISKKLIRRDQDSLSRGDTFRLSDKILLYTIECVYYCHFALRSIVGKSRSRRDIWSFVIIDDLDLVITTSFVEYGTDILIRDIARTEDPDSVTFDDYDGGLDTIECLPSISNQGNLPIHIIFYHRSRARTRLA